MARIIYSTHVDEIKGSIGGLTFHRNTSGSIVALKPVNRNISTKVQNEGKSNFTQLTSLWNSLSSGDKEGWRDELIGFTFVNRYNESKERTGFNYFMSTNVGRLLLGLAPLSTIGNYTNPVDVPAFTLDVNSTEILCTFVNTSGDPNVRYFFYASPPNRLPYSKQRTQFRLIEAVTPGGGLTFNLTASFETAYGIVWPISNETGAFNITVACCSFDIVHGCWSIFTITTASFVNP